MSEEGKDEFTEKDQESPSSNDCSSSNPATSDSSDDSESEDGSEINNASSRSLISLELQSTSCSLLDAELVELSDSFKIDVKITDDSIVCIQVLMPFYMLHGSDSTIRFDSFILLLSVELTETQPAYKFKDFSVSQYPDWLTSDQFSNLFDNLVPTGNIRMKQVITNFYQRLEATNYPVKVITVRDFYFPIYDPRHWGRPLLNPSNPSNIQSNYRVRALYSFQALMQGELSFDQDDTLQVLADLGNGWLSARRIAENSSIKDHVQPVSEDIQDQIGLIPENYIERIVK